MNEDLPNVESIIAPLNIQEQREAFGGPLYQMMNPSGKKIADAVSGGINSLTSDPMMALPGGLFAKMTRTQLLEELAKRNKIFKKLEFNFKREKYNFEKGGPDEAQAAASAMKRIDNQATPIRKQIEEIEDILNKSK
jgi:hypothetical protein